MKARKAFEVLRDAIDQRTEEYIANPNSNFKMSAEQRRTIGMARIRDLQNIAAYLGILK